MRSIEQYFALTKMHARQRGIAFKFTKDQWVTWWQDQLGPHWLKLRGKKAGQFVMSRIGDKGDYEPNNVRCILASDNCKERKKNGTTPFGEAHGQSKLTNETVSAIRNAKGSQREIARRFGICQGIVNQIKTGKTWRHV